VTGYETTPAGVLRQALGEPAAPSEYEQRFSAELPDREQAARHFAEAWGFADGRGLATERGWRRAELRAAHQRHAAGADWHHVTEEEEREIARRIRVAREAGEIAARAQAAGPPGMSPAEVAEWRQRTTGPVAGVAGPS